MFHKHIFSAWLLLVGAIFSLVWWFQTQQTMEWNALPCPHLEKDSPPCIQLRKGVRRDWIQAEGKKHWQMTAEQSSLSLGLDGAEVRWQENLQNVRFLQQEEGKPSYTLVADTAEYVEGNIQLTGQVQLHTPWGEMAGDRLKVLPPSKKELLASLFHWQGNVLVRVSGGCIRCEEAELDGSSRRGRCFGQQQVQADWIDPQGINWEMQAGEVAFRWGEGQEEIEAQGLVHIRQCPSGETAKKIGYEALASYARYRYGEKELILQGGKQPRVLLWDHARETRMSAPSIAFTWKEKGAPPFVKAEGDVRFVFQEEEYQRWKESVKTP